MQLLKDRWTCPKCQTDTQADRIPRSWLIKLLLGFLPLQRFMSYKCKRSYYTMKKEEAWTPHL